MGWKHANFTAERAQGKEKKKKKPEWIIKYYTMGSAKDGGCQWIPFKDTQQMSYTRAVAGRRR